MSNKRSREDILFQHLSDEEARDEDDKLWTGLWHATIPKDFLIIATSERFNGTVWSVFAYITIRMDLASGKSRRLENSEICEALGISEWTLDRAKATLKEYAFIEEQTSEGSVYYAKDIENATEHARLRRMRKQAEKRLEKHEQAITEEESRKGVSLSMRQRMEFIKSKFNEEYRPVIT